MQILTRVVSLCFIIISSIAVIMSYDSNFSYSIPNDDDVKIKFVSSDNVKYVTASSFEILPVFDKNNMYEENGFIVVKMDKNGVVVTPIDAIVERNGNNLTLHYENIKAELYGLNTLGVKNGEFVKKGSAIGTISGDTLKLKIYYNNKKLTLKQIEVFL